MAQRPFWKTLEGYEPPPPTIEETVAGWVEMLEYCYENDDKDRARRSFATVRNLFGIRIMWSVWDEFRRRDEPEGGRRAWLRSFGEQNG